MAVYGNIVNLPYGQYRSAININSVTTTNTTVSYKVYFSGQLKLVDGWSSSKLWIGTWNASIGDYEWVKTDDGNMACTPSNDFVNTNFAHNFPEPSGTYSRPRTHSNQRLWFCAEVQCSSYAISKAETYIDIPAKPSYTVSFNANGGSGAPTSQTKWYGETLTLSSTKPTRAGYKFEGWSTSRTGSATYSAGGSYTSNSGATLYAIWSPQASTITSVTNVTLPAAPVVKWTPLLNTFKYKIRYSINNVVYESAMLTPGSTSEQTYNSLTIPIADTNSGVAYEITNSTKGQMTCTLLTYDGNGNLLGSATKPFEVTLPSSIAPSFSQGYPSVSPVNANPFLETEGLFVGGYTQAELEAQGTATYGASIVGVSVSWDSESVSDTSAIDYTTGVLMSGTKSFKFKLLDSRGMAREQTVTQNIMTYSSPEITSFSVERGVIDTQLKLLGTWTYAPLQGYNSFSTLMQYRASDTATWTTISGTITSGVEITVTPANPAISPSTSYYVRLVITDDVGNSSAMIQYVPTSFIWEHMPAGGHGVGWGKFCEHGNFEVAYDMEVGGDITAQGLAVGNDLTVGTNGVGIHNLATPTSNYDAATKKYVDDTTSTAVTGLATETYVNTSVAGKLSASDFKRGSDSVNVTIAANSYKWASITVPTGRKLICPLGYYVSGTGNTDTVPYAFYQENATTIQIALRTWRSSQHTVTVTIYYLYV